MKLSLGRAWDETKGVLRSDGGLIATVALALLVLPGTVAGLIAPPVSQDMAQQSFGASLLMLAITLIGLAGQLAISRIALGPATTVGEAIGRGFRRLPAQFAAIFLLILPLTIIGTIIYLANGGTPTTPQQSPAAALLLLVLLPVLLFVAVRMLFISPLAVDSDDNPIELIKGAWRLSSGRWGKLLGLIVLVMIAALMLIIGLGGAVGSVLILLLGAPEAGSVSALLITLIGQILSAVVTTVFVIMVARLYRQATDGAATVSVPHAGRD